MQLGIRGGVVPTAQRCVALVIQDTVGYPCLLSSNTSRNVLLSASQQWASQKGPNIAVIPLENRVHTHDLGPCRIAWHTNAGLGAALA